MCDMSTRDRVSEHRRRLRERGMRPVQIWVPDVRTPEFRDAAAAQAQLVGGADSRTDDQEFIEAVSVGWDEE